MNIDATILRAIAKGYISPCTRRKLVCFVRVQAHLAKLSSGNVKVINTSKYQVMLSRNVLSLVVALVLLSASAFASPKPVRRCWRCGRGNFDLVNKYRASKGLKKVKWNWKLASQAAAHSKVMYTQRSMYHSNYGGWENVAFS